MPAIQSCFEEFHDSIQISIRDDNGGTLREKRDIVIDCLEESLEDYVDGDCPKFDHFNQGSYAMATGVIPPNGQDYDIDVGLRFYISPEDYEPITVKSWVQKCLDGHTDEVSFKDPCITVDYAEDYHVDLPVYAVGEGEEPYSLARGKENSLDENIEWQESEPRKFIRRIRRTYSDERQKQFRRVIRYLKCWRDEKFSADGNKAPIGIGLTILVRDCFSFQCNPLDGSPRDLDALIGTMDSILNNFYSIAQNGDVYKIIRAPMPVKPYDDVFSSITPRNQTQIYDRMRDFLTSLEKAKTAEKPVKSAKSIRKHLGERFPVPEPEEEAEKTSGPAMIGDSDSA
jgi:hypothetical protein